MSYDIMTSQDENWATRIQEHWGDIERENEENKVTVYPTETKDNVNNVKHYGGDFVMKFINFFKLNFARGNAIKYIARAGEKDPTKLIEDLEKAQWYLNWEINRLKEEKTMEGKSIANECSSPRNNEPRYNFLQAMPLMLQGHLFQDMSNINCYYHARGDKFFLQILGSPLTEIPQVEVRQMFEFDNLRLCSTHERLAQLEEFYRKCEEPKRGIIRIKDVVEDLKKGLKFIDPERLKIYQYSEGKIWADCYLKNEPYYENNSFTEEQAKDASLGYCHIEVVPFDGATRMNRQLRNEIGTLQFELSKMREQLKSILDFKTKLEQFGSK